ncbi:hypothetical protein BHE74_00044756 [Ensete ventricosum]|nr:hypothetical protein BHE74_00044756 [Ensete ventricosum]
MIGATGELDNSSAYIRLRELGKSKDKAEAEVRELHKTNVNGLLIKIAESGGLRVDARVFDQGTKYALHGTVPLGVGGKDDGEDCAIPEAAKTIKDLPKLLTFRKFNGSEKVNLISTHFKRHEMIEILAHNKEGFFPSSEGSTGINKNQHNSVDLTLELVIGELK